MDYEKYKNKMEYRQKPSVPIMHGNGTTASHRKHANDLEVYEKNLAVWDAERKAYDTETGRLNDLFKEDLLSELGIIDHPKADKLYEMAYSEGHSEGHSGVHHSAQAMVELLMYDEDEVEKLKVWLNDKAE